MRSIFRYPGGKTRSTIQAWIRLHRPERVCEYREPFVGGGGVFFGLSPQEFGRRWINDANEGLMSVYRALAERPDEFIQICREVEPEREDDPVTAPGIEGGLPQNARLKAVFERVALNKDCDQAFRYFFVNRTVFAGRVNYDRPSRLYFSKPEGWDVVKGRHLEQAAFWLRGVQITCGDFVPLFTEGGDGVWIYADPPYYRDTKFTGNSKLYQHGFTEADHRRLAGVVRSCNHPVALSYDDDPDGFIRSLYPATDFRLVENSWAYCGSTNAKKDRGRELLILNYDPPGRQRVFSFPEPTGETLTADERNLLAEHEAVIERGQRAAFEMGASLRVVRDRRLYRATARTFERYCRERWGMSHRHANRFIDTADVLDVLGPIGPKPRTESHARELARLRADDGAIDAEAVAVAWKAAVAKAEESGKPVTARLIREVVGGKDPGPARTRPGAVRDVIARLESLSPEELEEVRRFLDSKLALVEDPA